MFDSFVIERITKELTDRIKGHRVQRISQMAKDRFAFKFSATRHLIIDLSPQTYHISLSADKPVDHGQITGLYTGLRKHLTGARLLDIKQHDFDRTLELRFGNLSSIMEPVELSLYLEMMGRHANAILVDQAGLIIQALKFSDAQQHPIVMGEPYTTFSPRKKDPFESEDDFSNALQYKGFTKSLLRLLPEDIKERSISEIRHWLLTSNSPAIYTENDTLINYHLFRNGELSLVETEDIFEAMNRYYAQQPDHSKTSQIANHRHRLQARLKQVGEKIDRLEETAREFDQAEQFKNQADILYANLYTIEAGQALFSGFDFEGRPITIELDPAKTASQNAQKLYERYQKMTRGKKIVAHQTALAKKDQALLEQLLYDLDQISKHQEIEEFEAIMRRHGLIKTTKKQSAPLKSQPKEIIYRDTKYTIGRNSYQNEQLISQVTNRDFVWFHAKGIPGSHVVMHLPLSQADEDRLEYGAKLAASYSKAGPGVKVAVDYLRVGQLKKPRGAAPGFVTFTNQTTVHVVGEKIDP